MPHAIARHLALVTLANRAVVLVVLLRLILAFLGFLTKAPFASPAGVVLLTTALGTVDIVRRHETLFWANLGYSKWQTTGVFLVVGTLAELAFALLLKPAAQAALGVAR